jgi:class 3 adenylate cyclase
MSRPDCISNRNIKIVAAYLWSKLGTSNSIFDGLPYPADEYSSAEDFFLNEDEWTTLDIFDRIFRKAKELVDEPNFYFNCGASTARLRSWGRFHYFVRVFASPNEGFRRLPFFNKNFNDTKEIEIIVPPAYDSRSRKIRTLIKVEHHSDMDPNKDYIRDPYLRGIISSIPTIWGMPPASIQQHMNPYNPEVLFNQEPEFTPYGLDVKIEKDIMTIRDPDNGQRRIVGEKILLESEPVNGREVFWGKYTRSLAFSPCVGNKKEAILVTETIKNNGRVLLTEGEIFMAPYFILEASHDRFSLFHRISQFFKPIDKPKDSGSELIETIDQLRKSMSAKNKAYLALEKSNAELIKAKARLDEYASELEDRVENRTAELRKAQQDLLELNRDLESKVKKQVFELEKYNELRRYLSPKLTDKILTSGHTFGEEPQRKMMTVVFTDIRGFSNITDSLESEELFQLLDRYLSEMIKIIYRHDGTLNKIIGDGLLIFFGDPIPMEDHAERAVRMAVDMQRRVEGLLDEWRQFGHELGIGIGINTGYVTVGNIGSDIHRDYTVIGNQVNVAARLESMAGPGQILISQRTYSKIKDLFEVKEMGQIRVKGIHSPVKTYNVVNK